MNKIESARNLLSRSSAAAEKKQNHAIKEKGREEKASLFI